MEVFSLLSRSSFIRLHSLFLILDFLLFAKGRQYRPKELRLRLERVGFDSVRHIELVDDYSLVVATKPH